MNAAFMDMAPSERYKISKVEEEAEEEDVEDVVNQEKENVKVLYFNANRPTAAMQPPVADENKSIPLSDHFQPVRESDNEYVSSNADQSAYQPEEDPMRMQSFTGFGPIKHQLAQLDLASVSDQKKAETEESLKRSHENTRSSKLSRSDQGRVELLANDSGKAGNRLNMSGASSKLQRQKTIE